MELESRLNGGGGGGGGLNEPTPFTPSSAALSGPEPLGGAPIPPYSPQQDGPTHWHGVQNRFPAIAFLDNESFTHGG